MATPQSHKSQKLFCPCGAQAPSGVETHLLGPTVEMYNGRQADRRTSPDRQTVHAQANSQLARKRARSSLAGELPRELTGHPYAIPHFVDEQCRSSLAGELAGELAGRSQTHSDESVGDQPKIWERKTIGSGYRSGFSCSMLFLFNHLPSRLEST